MFYYLYELKNTINNKVYIGVHETNDLNDGYMGSGNLIKKALKKYNQKNFIKTILEYFQTREDMYAREKEIVNESFIKKSDTYNISLGGLGGSMKQNQRPFTKKHSEKSKALMSKNSAFRRISCEKREEMKTTHWSKTRPEEQKKHAIYAGRCRWRIKKQDVTSLLHLEETKRKISETHKKKNAVLRELGLPHPNIGIKREKIICPFCGKQGAANVIKRWHFNNCKHTSSVDIA